jgi:glycosyltransferase involved in cell wall biosynthesis
MKQLTIGLDAKRIVRNGTGLGSYGRTLANDLAGVEGLDLRLYVPDLGRDALRQQVPERPNLHYCLPDYPLATQLLPLASLRKAFWRSKSIVSQLMDDRVNVFHGLSGELPLGISQTSIKTVVTIHDLIFLRHPEYYNWIDTKIYAWKFRQTLREADRIVAISECTKRDIIELGGVDPAKIDLIYQSCAARFSRETNPQKQEEVRQKYGLPARYVLSVGSIEERKNTLLALKALHWLPGEVNLVLVGKKTPYLRKLVAYAKANNLASRLFLLHGVPDDDLPALYAGAEVFVYPSRYEGFGIPIIEAVRMGLPVVGCTGSCLEEAGGPDNLYVSPDDPEAMAKAIIALQKGAEGREQRIERSQQYIRRFENNDTALRFAQLYQEVSQL